MASSSRSERELIELMNANQHLSDDELKDLINADQPPMTQEEHDQFNDLLKTQCGMLILIAWPSK